MKATGIVRRIDDLGRVVIPKEIRKTLKIHEGSPLEIFTDSEANVIFKKYSPVGEFSNIAQVYAQTISEILACTCLVSDTDKIIAASGSIKKEFLNKPISEQLRNYLLDNRAENLVYNLKICEVSEKNARIITKITNSGDIFGSVILLDIADEGKRNIKEYLNTISKLLAKQIE